MATAYQENALIKAQRDAFEGIVSECETLQAKGNWSPDELKLLREYPQRLKEAEANLQSAIELEKSMQSAKGLMGNANLMPIGAVAKAELAAIQNAAQKAMGQRTTWEGKSGHETYGVDPITGKMVPIEGDGAVLSDRTLKAIQEPTYMRAFEIYARKGQDALDKADFQVLMDAKTLSEGADSGGGFFVPPQYIAQLIQRKPHPTRLMSYVETVPCSADQVIWPRINNDSDTADIYVANSPRIQWIGEKGPTPSQADPNFGNVTVEIHTGQFFIECSRNLLEDSQIPLSMVIGKLGGQAYDLGLDNALVSGTGINQPVGLLTNAGGAGDYCPVVNCGNPVTAAGLINLVEGMPPQYTDSDTTVALMNKINAWATFSQITDGSGQLIFGLARSQGPEGLASKRVHKLLGFDVIFSPFMPNTGAGNNVVAFGDPKDAYIFCQRVGMTIETYGTQDRSMIQKNALGWNFRFRCGGQTVQSRAVHIGQQS